MDCKIIYFIIHDTNNYNTEKLYFAARRLSNVGEAVSQKWWENRPRERLAPVF